MTRLPAGPIAPPAAGIQLQFGPHGYPSSRAGSRKVEGTISGAVAWPDRLAVDEGLHADRSGHREAGPQELGGVIAYLA
jgi:hypothetical protein